MISAEILADSISPEGHRLTTFKLRYPRFIHSEFMTHRVISRNASSSRAVPTAKLIEEVRSDALRASPIWWGKNQPGMQAQEENTALVPRELPGMPFYDAMTKGKFNNWQTREEAWREAAECAADFAECFASAGYHKQIVNRLLEPFTHINVVASATEWDNFFGLRLHADAQPEMRALAFAMSQARSASTPKLLQPGQWHLPFIDNDFGLEFAIAQEGKELPPAATIPIFALRVSVARCARVSYESFTTGRKSEVEEDLELYDRLVGSHPIHASPAEHQATPDSMNDYIGAQTTWQRPEEHGNFVGWRQFRKSLPGEARASLPDEFLPF